ncbi:MAG: DNA-protecting protein DprA [Clostridiales bacterium]|nr:DNA-protecting protein DprA [Clostridiales bacterium]
MDVRVYWLWLQRTLGPGNREARRLLMHFGGVQALYRATAADLQGAGVPEAGQKRLSDKELSVDQRLLSSVLSSGAWLLTPDDAYYPSVLFGLPDPPLVLYGLGELPDLEHRAAMGMVGTRRASEEGKRTARELAGDFACHGMIVISGGAVGIDAACHEGALQAGGRTVVVQACGLDIDYPRPNAELRRKILSSGGAILTEYPPGIPPDRRHFPVRNRLISGLSAGICVIEAPARSGALITARLALEQGRDVFAVPGAIRDRNSEGANDLIKQGARLITGATEVLEEYRLRFPDILEKEPVSAPMPPMPQGMEEDSRQRKAAGKKPPRPCPPEATEPERLVYQALLPEMDAAALDELAASTGLPVPELLTTLTLLEMKGTVQALPGRRYTLVRD